MSHQTEVNVVDADNGKLIGTITTRPEFAMAIASELNTAHQHGRENKVSMFDTDTLKLINKIDVGKGPDGISDPGNLRVFTNNRLARRHGDDAKTDGWWHGVPGAMENQQLADAWSI
jgi:hypothetical protein